MNVGKIELYGKDKMKDIISEIKSILEKKNINTRAGETIKNYSGEVENTIKKQGLNATSNSSSKKSDVEEDKENIVDRSRKDLKIKDDEEEETSDRKVKTGDESPSTINLSDAQNFEKLIDILNQFRAAHSFTDEEVSARLRDYFDSLEREEKEVLHVFIKGLVQITVLDVDGKDAYTPDKLMFKIKKTGSASSEKKKSMERKIDNTDIDANQDAEDMPSGEGVPIVTIGAGVYESSINKKSLINIVKKNNQ